MGNTALLCLKPWYSQELHDMLPISDFVEQEVMASS